MDRHLARESQRAHKEEVRAERKETRLHGRAMTSAIRGNFGKAAALESRAQRQHVQADRAHGREQAANFAMATRPGVPRHHHPHVVPLHVAPGHPSTYTITQTTTYTAGQPAVTHQCTPTAPPAGSYATPPAGSYPPPPPYPGYGY